MTDAVRPRRTVLVVEDDHDIRLALRALLVRAGLRVLAAPDGATGLRLFADHVPAAVVLDLGLPDMSGWEVLARIRDLGDVPVLVLTAQSAAPTPLPGPASPLYEYLSKPFDNAELVRRVLGLVGRNHAPAGWRPAPGSWWWRTTTTSPASSCTCWNGRAATR